MASFPVEMHHHHAARHRVRSAPPLYITFSFLLLLSSAFITVSSQNTTAGKTPASSPLSGLPAAAARAAAAAAAAKNAAEACSDPPCAHGGISEAVRMLVKELEAEMKKNEGWNTEKLKREEKWSFVAGEKQEQLRDALVLLTQGIRRRVADLEKREKIEYDEKKFRELGCIAVGTFNVKHFGGVAGLFPSAYLARLTVSLTPLEAGHGSACSRSVTPLAVNVHGKRHPSLPPCGTLNTQGACSSSAVGDIYSPFLIPSEIRGNPTRYGQGQNEYGYGPWGSPFQNDGCGMPSEYHDEHGGGSDSRYKCSPSLYRQRPFSCRPGHLTGKFGYPRDVSPSVTTADLRIIALDTHAESPCVVGEEALPLVVSCSKTCHNVACTPFRRLETGSVKGILGDMHALLLASENSASVVHGTPHLEAFLHVTHELQKRVLFLECGKEHCEKEEKEEEK